MLNRRILAALPESPEEHISFSTHEPHVINSLHNYSKQMTTMQGHGHVTKISNKVVYQQDHHQFQTHPTNSSVLPPLTINNSFTVMSSPHVKYHHHVEVSNNLQTTTFHSHAMVDHLQQRNNNITCSNGSTTTNVNFPIMNKNISNSNTKTKEDSPSFIVDYMFKENAGIKKSKKIKRKYEFKRKEGLIVAEVEKPLQVRVSYIAMEEDEFKSCESLDEVLEKYHNANETCFNYSKDQRISILPVDSNIKLTKKRTVENITTDEMIRILHLTQQQACNLLGCSLSTIKRKFYSIRNELGIDKWPHNYLEYQHYSFFNDFYPMSMKFILNDETETCSNESNS